MPIQRDSSASSVRAALFFAASAAAVTLLLNASRNAAVLIALLTNPIAAIVPSLVSSAYPPLIHLRRCANMTADIFGPAGAILIVLFPIICHY